MLNVMLCSSVYKVRHCFSNKTFVNRLKDWKYVFMPIVQCDAVIVALCYTMCTMRCGDVLQYFRVRIVTKLMWCDLYMCVMLCDADEMQVFILLYNVYNVELTCCDVVICFSMLRWESSPNCAASQSSCVTQNSSNALNSCSYSIFLVW
jgi:hypothetical protein